METGTSRIAVQVFCASVLALAGIYAVLVWESRSEADISLSFFATICIVAFALSLIAARSIYLSAGRITFKHLFYGCVLIRAIAVFGEPVFEDDYYRYLWDGRQTVETGSPYSNPPAAAFGVELSDTWSGVLDNINYPELKNGLWPVKSIRICIGVPGCSRRCDRPASDHGLRGLAHCLFACPNGFAVGSRFVRVQPAGHKRIRVDSAS